MNDDVTVSEQLTARLGVHMRNCEHVILNALAANPSITNTELAKATGYSIRTVKEAISRYRYFGFIGQKHGDREVRTCLTQ